MCQCHYVLIGLVAKSSHQTPASLMSYNNNGKKKDLLIPEAYISVFPVEPEKCQLCAMLVTVSYHAKCFQI